MLDATQVRVGVTGHIYKAPKGTTLPVDLAELGPAWVDLGYTETLPTRNVDTSSETFTPAQSDTPVREAITGQLITETFTLWQTNHETLKLAYRGGTVTLGTGGVRIFTPPARPAVGEGVFVMDIIDGEIVDRLVLKRASYKLSGEVQRNKSNVTGYPITLTHMAPEDGSASWYSVTNDENVEVDA